MATLGLVCDLAKNVTILIYKEDLENIINSGF